MFQSGFKLLKLMLQVQHLQGKDFVQVVSSCFHTDDVMELSILSHFLFNHTTHRFTLFRVKLTFHQHLQWLLLRKNIIQSDLHTDVLLDFTQQKDAKYDVYVRAIL